MGRSCLNCENFPLCHFYHTVTMAQNKTALMKDFRRVLRTIAEECERFKTL